ncbi:MAG: hypothetical protein ABID64_03370 [Nitrospirota bacterium]
MKYKKGEYSVRVNNKNYPYTISESEYENAVFFECKAARLSQVFDVRDLPELFLYLPEYILDEIGRRKEEKDVIRFRVTTTEKTEIAKKAQKNGFKNVSSYLRFLALK